MTDLARLDAEFTTGEVRQFQGRGGQTFDYIEDETVMDRLDEVIGKGEWSLRVEPISVADGIVKVTLSALGQTFEDFGYASNSGPNAESLKEAVSDGIRRCGRYLGIGRYLYAKRGPSAPARPARQQPTQAVQSAPQRPTVVPSQAAAPDDPYADLPWEGDAQPVNVVSPGFQATNALPPNLGEECPVHPGERWKGEIGDLYHRKPEGGYCRPEGQPKKARAR